MYATRRDSTNRLSTLATATPPRRSRRSFTTTGVTPRYIVWSEAGRADAPSHWRFVVQTVQGHPVLEAADCEPGLCGERLELLAAVRGLEALDRPSQVVLVTSSRYVRRGLAFGLEQWRQNGWRWESYGQLVPVKNVDLWQRLDRALRIHQVQSGGMRWLHRPDLRFDPPQKPRPTDRVRNAYRRLRQSVGTANATYSQDEPVVTSLAETGSRNRGAVRRKKLGRPGHGIPAPHCRFGT